jgi:transposase
VLGGLHELEQRGQLKVFYFDESGVSLTPMVPYAWQPVNETLELPAFSHQRANLLGFMNRHNVVYHHAVEGRVTSHTVITAMDDFINQLDSDVPTVVVLDNARIHTSAEVLAQRDRWLAEGLMLYYLPTYSPELNLIEILWRKLKYEWLPFSAYLSFGALKNAIAEVFDNIGEKYRIILV